MVFYENDENSKVTRTHYFPDKLDTLENGFLLDYTYNTEPKPKELEGKEAVKYASAESGVWYEYVNEKVDKLVSLEQQVLEVQQYIVDKEANELLNQGGM